MKLLEQTCKYENLQEQYNVLEQKFAKTIKEVTDEKKKEIY